MLKFTLGDILRCETEAIVNTVNTVGVMGKGIALAFKKAFPTNFKLYEKACKEGNVEVGKMFVTETEELYPKYIINFPTKKHWRNPSKYEYITAGLEDLIEVIKKYKIKSISIPPLGAGNGRLEWTKVKSIIEQYLSEISKEMDIVIFEPGYQDQTTTIPRDASLTDKRAIFLYMLWKYQVLGYQTNLIVAQKVAYFIQRFQEDLNLVYQKGIYGPYAHNLTHLLKKINNTYIQYDENKTAPMTPIQMIEAKYDEIETFFKFRLSEDQHNKISRLVEFIEGFESPYGLELLATIDFIYTQTQKDTIEEIESEIGNWTDRKREIMKSKHIEIAIERLREFDLIK
jgi:O-acetyl-ADP-ribose deacetylase (regulator of RNase III)